MFSNYFKIAFRNVTRHRIYSLINVAGLAIGISVCLVIFLIIRYHASYDSYHAKKDRIYRVLTEFHHADSKIFYSHAVPFGIPNGLKASFPGIEEVTPLLASHNDQFIIPAAGGADLKKFKEENGTFFSDPSFFRVFDFPLLAGSPQSLAEPGTVFLAKETAEKYFGDWNNAVGRILRMNNDIPLKVGGILASIPSNTDLRIKALVAYGTGYTVGMKTSTDYDGVNQDFGSYLLLPAGASPVQLEKQLRAYARKAKAPFDKDELTIEPLTEAHYDTGAGSFSGKGISHSMITILWLIAAFLLLIACVNFINLTTAQAVTRAREVGVRKTLGSNRSQLRLQFLSETFTIVLGAILLSLLLTWLALPYVNGLLELPLRLDLRSAGPVVLFLGLTAIGVTLLAGLYPSVVLSRFNPVSALKNTLASANPKGISLRRGLVAFQFVIAQVLIIGTLVIVKQMHFFSTQPVGFDKEAIVNIPLPTDSVRKLQYQPVKSALLAIPGVEHVSLASNTPIEDNSDLWTTFFFDHAPQRTGFYTIFKAADKDYLTVYDLTLLAGRNLQASDTIREMLVNQQMLGRLGIRNPSDALNKEIAFNDQLKGRIVGVLKDFHTGSFRGDLAPLAISTFSANYRQVSVKLATKNVLPAMRAIEKLWGATYPDYVYEYKFLDDKIAAFYRQESQLARLYEGFACIVILLSCLGLYGLSSFMAAQRRKEVGIRKVLGASIQDIATLFSREFVALIAIAFVIATPLAGYFMHQWLSNFVYRTDLSWWIFLTGGLISLTVALATVSFHAIRSALANPVRSLRSE